VSEEASPTVSVPDVEPIKVKKEVDDNGDDIIDRTGFDNNGECEVKNVFC